MESSPSSREWHFKSRKNNWPDIRPRCRFIQDDKVTDFPSGIIRPNILILSNDKLAALDPTLEDDEKAPLIVILAKKFDRKSKSISVLKEFVKPLSVNAKAVGVFLVEGIGAEAQAGFAAEICNNLGDTSVLLKRLKSLVKKHEANGFYYYDSAVFVQRREAAAAPRAKSYRGWNSLRINKGVLLEGMRVRLGLSDRIEGNNEIELTEIPRYLQAKITEPGTQDPPLSYLIARRQYTALVRIGAIGNGWQNGEVAVDPKDLAPAPGQDRAVIKLKFVSSVNPDIPDQTIEILPGQDSSIAAFVFDSGEANTPFQASIFAYHGNRQIQQILLSAPVLEDSSAFSGSEQVKVSVVVALRTELAEVESRPVFGSSIYIDDEKMVLVHNGVSKTFRMNNTLGYYLNRIQDVIQKSILRDNSLDLIAPENGSFLRALARLGKVAYDECLRDNGGVPDGPIQIVSMGSKIIPVDWLYSRPVPGERVGLCPHAKEALEAGTCMGCCDPTEEPATYVCPFGFLCLSHVIERHSQNNVSPENPSSYIVQAEPKGKNPVLNVFHKTLYASSVRVNGNGQLNRESIKAAIEDNADDVYEAVNWENWKELVVSNSPDSLILLVHVDKEPESGLDRIEIETGQFLDISLLVGERIKAKNATSPPIVIALGCESTNVDHTGFDLSSRFLRNGAAFVLSSFTKIRGSQLSSVVPKLMELIRARSGQETRFGEIMLQLRQQLLAQGVMVVLSLVAHGDADWKIKS